MFSTRIPLTHDLSEHPVQHPGFRVKIIIKLKAFDIVITKVFTLL